MQTDKKISGFSQLRALNEHLEGQLKQCDHDLSKMLVECDQWKIEEYSDAEYYHKKWDFSSLNS
jgi:hypothetical protein